MSQNIRLQIAKSALLADALSLTGMNFGALEIADFDALNLDQVREEIVRQAPELNIFCLAIGMEETGRAADGADWTATLSTPLKRCFKVLNAAGRHLVARRPAGSILAVLPSMALVADPARGKQSTFLRALLGLLESLRAELLAGDVRVTIVFYDPDRDDGPALAERCKLAIQERPLYRLSPDLSDDVIEDYFRPMFEAFDRTAHGPPLPEIEAMGAVYKEVLQAT